MQFSLKWILAATAYVALAAAAFSQGTWYFTDILWAASLLAVVYALLLASFARGKRQVIAAGFAVASLFFVLVLHFGGAQAVATPRILYAAGVGSEPAQWIGSHVSSGQVLYTISATPPVSPVPPGAPPVDHYLIYLRAANAVGMMAFGLLGCLVGALAFRAAAAKAAG